MLIADTVVVATVDHKHTVIAEDRCFKDKSELVQCLIRITMDNFTMLQQGLSSYSHTITTTAVVVAVCINIIVIFVNNLVEGPSYTVIGIKLEDKLKLLDFVDKLELIEHTKLVLWTMLQRNKKKVELNKQSSKQLHCFSCCSSCMMVSVLSLCSSFYNIAFEKIVHY